MGTISCFNSPFLGVLFCVGLFPLGANSNALLINDPQGFSNPEGYTLGTTQVFFGTDLKVELTDNELLEAKASKKDGYRATAAPTLSGQGKIDKTTYFFSLGASNYATWDSSDDRDNQWSYPIAAGVTQAFNEKDILSVSGSYFSSDETNSPQAGADAYDLSITSKNISSTASFAVGNYTIGGDASWTGSSYDYQQTEGFTIEVDRDQYDYGISLGRTFNKNLIKLGVGGSSSMGDTADGSVVDVQQIQIGLSAEGSYNNIGYQANLVYGQISYSVDTIKNQEALLGSMAASYQHAKDALIRAELKRSFINNILTDEAGYISNSATLTGQYDFSEKTFLRPQISYEVTEVLSTKKNYATSSLNVTIGQRLTENVALYVGYTHTKQLPNDPAKSGGYENYSENKLSFELKSKF